ncbi:MAG: hypothetical protein GWM90_17965, partial [Gemmatimonadetes bacterium]|nr:hypothetical protein [Gemmatimonadota bacterium]NIQ56243.1 hypothetical protein [Gemmatimonadota bacterium]NIU76431.1 hypothetical protein [Gammaproteobacteria bacterium]NIX45908.1 hypothetical protein [Gemmatimonadota bacterium]NIY10220.1 hypothetical protein [Gemmatimonadota bacterium]
MIVATRRDGFALPAALLALVIVGALVTGGVYAAMEEDRTSTNAGYSQQAFLAAEWGLEEVLGTLTRPYFENMGIVGQADTIGPVSVTIDNVPAQYTVYVQRVATRLFHIVSEGEVTGGGRYAGSKRRLAEVMRITYTYFPNDRAVTTHVPLRLVGKSGIRGMDSIPDTWGGCPTSLGDTIGVVAKDVSTISIHGAVGQGGGLYGSPEKVEDPTLDY